MRRGAREGSIAFSCSTSALLSSSIMIGSVSPKRASASFGSQLGSSSPDSSRAVATMTKPGTIDASLTISTTVSLSSALKKSRLSIYIVAPPSFASSTSNSRSVPSKPSCARHATHPRGTHRPGLSTMTGPSVCMASAICRRIPDFPTPASPRIST